MDKKYPAGSIVACTSLNLQYGVVINQEYWLTVVGQENPDDAKNFIKHESEHGAGFMIPLLYFGVVVGDKLIQDGEDVFLKRYVQQYGYSNVGGNIRIIPGGVEELLGIIWHVQTAFGRMAAYHQEVRDDLIALNTYLGGGYNLDSLALGYHHKDMIKLYEKSLPGLAGSKKSA